MHPLADIIRQHATPLDPDPTGVEPQIDPLPGIRAVLFDVYGTLIISGSGDIGLASAEGKETAIREAATAVGVDLEPDHTITLNDLKAMIATHHERIRHERGIDFPEVSIAEVWRELFIDRGADPHTDWERFAVEYEVRTNPVWPMPRLSETLATLKRSPLALGIISNAQFFTPLMFEAFLQVSPEELGFEPKLLVWSFEHRAAKPGTRLYEQARQRLEEFYVPADQVLYVGNDVRNDVSPAREVGFRTVLFAGDARSLRWRADDERVRDVVPDRIITSIDQILPILGLPAPAGA